MEWRRRALPALAGVAIALNVCVVFWSARDAPMFDLIPIYAAALAMADDADTSRLYELDPETLHPVAGGVLRRAAARAGFPGIPTPYPYPPLLAWTLQPVTALSYDNAKRMLLGVEALCFFGALALLPGALGAPSHRAAFLAAAALALLVFHPLRYATSLGQTTPLVFALLCLAPALLQRGWRAAAGVVLAAGLCVKPALGFVPLALLLGRDLRTPLACGAALVGVLALGVWTSGLELTRSFVQMLADVSGIGSLPAWNNQSLLGVCARIVSPLQEVFRWRGWSPPLWARVIHALALLTWLGAGVRALLHRRDAQRDAWALGWGILGCCLLSPVAWSHYGVFALLPFAALALGSADWRTRAALGVVFALFAVDPERIAAWLAAGQSGSSAGGWRAMAISTGAAGALLLTLLLYRDGRRPAPDGPRQ